MEVLVLDVAYQPHSRIPWTEAIVKIIVDKTVEVVEEYPDDYIRTVNWRVNMPSVVRLLKPVAKKRAVKFSRHGIYARDRGRCQYCGRVVPRSEFQYEHVVPRAQGGRTCWENIVVSCLDCNQEKGDRTPAQAGMRLLSVPVRPKSLPATDSGITYQKGMPEAWRSYLRDRVYWDAALDEG